MSEPRVEAYVTRAELARRMGLSVQTIDRMAAAGMPSETWGRRTRRFLPSEAMTWAREQGYRGSHDGSDDTEEGTTKS